ncbi:MAG: hypothetical protein KDE46_24365 [Caldilineaceae bacterium]|nr:hypothetical protein [Caldilineaceae bacterium]
MAILQLVDQLAEMLNQGRDVPLSRYRMIDADEFGQMIERMRISVPSSIRESERTLAERDKIVAAAQAEAAQIVHEAKQRAMEMLHENTIIKMARQEADRIIAESEKVAQQRESEADQYATQVLGELAEKLKTMTRQIDNGLRLMNQPDDAAQ